jgi:hypothetical protein
MSKIKKITVSNLKAVSNLTADFNGCTAIITGGNNKGKSSFLRSLSDRLSKAIKPEQIVKQGEKEGFYEMELTTGEKFVWAFNNTTKAGEKLTFISERNIPGPVTKELSKFYFPPVFDVDTFLQAAPKKQKEILQKLTGIDFTEFDKLYIDAYEQRTYANKKLAEEKAKASYIDPKIISEPIDTTELEKQLYGIDTHNLKFKTVNDKLNDKKVKVITNNKEIDRLAKLIEDLSEENKDLEAEILKGDEWVADEKNKPKTQLDIDTLTQELENLREQNEAIRKNNEAKQQDVVIEKAIANAEAADVEVKKLEAEKLEVIKNSTLPEGFGFSEEGITYEGFDFNKESLSSSRIYIAALKLAALGLGEVKTLHFDASFLDKNSLYEIEKWANENDLQLLIERPDFEGGEIEYQILETTI